MGGKLKVRGHWSVVGRGFQGKSVNRPCEEVCGPGRGEEMSGIYGLEGCPCMLLRVLDRLVGLVVKASASRAEDPGFESRLQQGVAGSSYTNELKIALQWIPCQASGNIGSALGLVGPVSVFCDWAR